MGIDSFFSRLWDDYVAMTPQAARIKAAFEGRGERVVNDHVAFRTLALEPIRLAALEPHLLAIGYEPYEPYDFKEKKLSAYGYLHPDPERPRVFLSELRVHELSAASARILEGLAAQVDPARVADPSVLWAGQLWEPVSWSDYQTLQDESEYAAWVASIGIRPNHFTIGINFLQHTTDVEGVLQVVEGLGYKVNSSGGRVKGTPAELLEQGSTLADKMPITFAGGEVHDVPTCYYEFAKRYPTESGQLYPGFIAASADKIFESTNAKR
jgi:Domain of unknown function (DUF1338)